MKMSKKIRTLLDEAKKTDAYWVERAKLDFSLGLEKQRRAGNFTYAAIAQKIGTSAAYISKVFRGDSNVTIETMVKLARATGGQLDIQIVDSATHAARWDVERAPMQNLTESHATMETVTRLTFPVASNSDAFMGERLALVA